MRLLEDFKVFVLYLDDVFPLYLEGFYSLGRGQTYDHNALGPTQSDTAITTQTRNDTSCAHTQHFSQCGSCILGRTSRLFLWPSQEIGHPSQTCIHLRAIRQVRADKTDARPLIQRCSVRQPRQWVPTGRSRHGDTTFCRRPHRFHCSP